MSESWTQQSSSGPWLWAPDSAYYALQQAWPQSQAWHWTPESLLPLSSSPITASQFEGSLFNCLGEWLNGYFNSGMHTINNLGSPILFPAAQIKFQQQPMPQPLNGAVIWLVMEDQGVLVEKQVMGQYQGWQRVHLCFYARANVRNDHPAGANSDWLCSLVADRLYGLLSDRGATIPLQEKGFRWIRVHPPAIKYDTQYETRMVRAHFMLIFGTPASNLQNGGTSSFMGGD